MRPRNKQGLSVLAASVCAAPCVAPHRPYRKWTFSPHLSFFGSLLPWFQDRHHGPRLHTKTKLDPKSIYSLLLRLFSFSFLPPVNSILGVAARIMTAFVMIHIGGSLLLLARPNTSRPVCKGWQCELVTCWKGYAVYVPEKNAYLPCEDFERYTEGRDVSVLIKRGAK